MDGRAVQEIVDALTASGFDAQIWAIMALLSVAFVLIPFIPGVRSIPKWIPIYKLTGRNYYHARKTGERAEPT